MGRPAWRLQAATAAAALGAAPAVASAATTGPAVLGRALTGPGGADPDTTVTFAVTSGALTMTAPVSADLGSGAPGLPSPGRWVNYIPATNRVLRGREEWPAGRRVAAPWVSVHQA